MALRIEEEGCDESVGYVEEEGLGVPLGSEVEVGEGWSTVGVSDCCRRRNAIRGKVQTDIGQNGQSGHRVVSSSCHDAPNPCKRCRALIAALS